MTHQVANSKAPLICHITSAHPRYDIRVYVKEAQSLARSNYNTHLIVADGLGDEIKDTIHIYDVGCPSTRRERMRITPKQIFSKVLDLKPQIVHFHDPELMLIGRKLAKLGYQVIYDVHEDVPKQVLSKNWIPKPLRKIVSFWVSKQEKKTAKLCAAIVCATDIIANRFRKYNPDTISLFNYPILAELSQIQVDWNARTNRLCYIGSIAKTRGVVPLVNSLTESKLDLDLAGPFSDSAIMDEVQSLPNYKTYVRYHGILNREEVAKLLATVKVGIVTLLPTPSYVESLPIKLLEYMLAGIPVVASNFPLWQDLVKGCGFMVDPADSHAIANACSWLINNPDEARLMGERGRQKVLAHYTWEVEQSKLVELYSRVMAKN
jgi:hypothetical protein